MSSKDIKQIIVRWGSYIDYLQISHRDNYVVTGGGGGGAHAVAINMEDDEYVMQIYGRYREGLDEITFVTNKHKHGPFGTRSGGYHDYNYQKQGYKIRIQSLGSWKGLFLHLCGAIKPEHIHVTSSLCV